MSDLRMEITRPTTGDNALDTTGMVLHSSGEFSEAGLFGQLVIWLCDLFHIDSPYHNLDTAQRVETMVAQLKTLNPNERRYATSHLGALEQDFIVHSREQSHGGIHAAFKRARAALNPSSAEAVRAVTPPPFGEPPVTFDDLVDEYMTDTSHVRRETSALDRQYSGQILSKTEVKALRVELSKLGLKQLVGQYGEELVRSVVPNFDRIERGEAFLDLKHNDEDRAISVIVRLTDAKVKRDGQIKVKNERFLGRMSREYGDKIVSKVAKRLLTPDESANRVGFGYQRRQEFEAHCQQAQRMAASEQEMAKVEAYNFLHSGLFNDLLFIPGMEGHSKEAVQAEVMTGIAGQDTATCVEWVRHVFSDAVGDQIIASAFNAMQVEMTLQDAAKIDGSNISRTLQVDAALEAALEENFGEGIFSGKVSAGDAFEAAVMQAFQSKR